MVESFGQNVNEYKANKLGKSVNDSVASLLYLYANQYDRIYCRAPNKGI